MAKDDRDEVPGIWMRGADGALYFIPNDDLETFRVPDEVAEPALKDIDDNQPEAVGFAASGAGGGKVIFQDFHAIPGTGIRPQDIAAAPAIIPPPASLRGLREPDAFG